MAKNRKDEGVVVQITGKGGLSDVGWAGLHALSGPQMRMKAVSNPYLLKKGE